MCITGRNAEGLHTAVDELGGPDVALAVAGSADDAQHQQAAVDATVGGFGGLDVLVNNTGINPAFGSMLEVDTSAMRKMIDVNVIAALSWLRTALAAGLDRRGGAVVNVASVAGLRPARSIGFYGASKAALIHLTMQMAAELAPAVRVNAVAPAVVRTRFAGPLYEGKEDDVVSEYPLRRLGLPADVAAAVAYLASHDASWVNGQVLTVDGGLTLRGGV
ncbi:SDR family oxidoreductase [Blastococcus brunescens]|uniref:SDR family oxidoreductase n=1 Tax=Blastococcus brunescens TaxID=1564165 RepID=A0ABZ1B8Q7_9ACTN|nr:SDR family oxidoreductase [Blastococcus sp. BMG 8361]WRL65440.1 SDR family oxidoreductase [Blastococcus sp. BMG 8361]